ncbi:stage V sporulation protein AD [Paenibacillus chartarius]|uniref:Stage V sporulation protein AD n=1 Tax=Paenibacillus chartarius TaxID=747481 RepID=A0ABV6DTG2_9BACL
MLQGQQSWSFEQAPVIIGTGTVVGPEEGKGPIANDFDRVHSESLIGESSWERAERKLLGEATELAMKHAGKSKDEISFYVGGDLMNQIISNTFAIRDLSIPYLGIFGACSTSMEGLALAALMVSTNHARYAMCGTCSHNSSVEKQFRYPTEYGAQKAPTAQFTVTGAGAAVLAPSGEGPVVTGATIGKVVDMGIKDPNNMGAAMAPAAVDTIAAHLRDFNREPGYYDLIVTGDLASVGHAIAIELFKERGIPIGQTDYKDCAMLIYDLEKQKTDVQAGGSGAACSATVTYGHLLKRMRRGELKRILVAATGSLHSPLTYQQGETIPCIAHAVAIEMKEE